MASSNDGTYQQQMAQRLLERRRLLKHAGKSDLKHAKVCRLFLSSPFLGMELEREELTKKYIPQLQSLCASRGVKLMVVDMRWGITSEASNNAQTVSICLRELERSDIFVGFFGQRYGWHIEQPGSASAKAFQQNIDNAKDRYPWLLNMNDRSVTEIEFLVGHLNEPGKMPACICFRDKSYDDQMIEHARLEETRNKKKYAHMPANKRPEASAVRKYRSESEMAAHRLALLKERCEKTSEHTIGQLMDYREPAECAKFIFDSVRNTLLELVKNEGGERTQRELLAEPHEAYLSNQSSRFIGSEQYQGDLKAILTSEREKGALLCVTGQTGIGKTALLADWIRQCETTNAVEIIFYHFVGCVLGSDKRERLLQRAISELHCCLTGEETQDFAKENSLLKLTAKFQDLLGHAAKENKQVLIVVDGLDKFEDYLVIKKLFWVPQEIPKGVVIIVSTSVEDTILLTELESLQHKNLAMKSLKLDHKSELLEMVMRENSKELAEDQIGAIIRSEQTANPLFLKTVFEELRIFGDFRKLKNKIEVLVSCRSFDELLDKCLARVENDFKNNIKTAVIGEILSGLVETKNGLSDTEIEQIFAINNDKWNELYHSIKTFIALKYDLFRISFHGLELAIRKRYLYNEQKRKHIWHKLCGFFYPIYELASEHMITIDERTGSELPALLSKLNDRRLQQVLTNPYIMKQLKERPDEITHHWQTMGTPQVTIAELFIKELDNIARIIKSKHPDSSEKELNLRLAREAYDFLHDAATMCYRGTLPQTATILYKKTLEVVRGLDGIVDESARYKIMFNIGAALDSEGEHEESLMYRTQVLEYRELKIKMDGYSPTDGDWEELSNSYASVGKAYIPNTQADNLDAMAKDRMRKALMYFEKSNEFMEKISEAGRQREKDRAMASNYCFMGLCYSSLKEHDKAENCLNKSLVGAEEYHFGDVPLNVAGVMHSLAQVYSHHGKFREAEKWYQRSLNIEISHHGESNVSTADTIFNMGSHASRAKEHNKAYGYYKRCLDIYQSLLPPDSPKVMSAMKSCCLSLCRQQKHIQGDPYFWMMFELDTKNGTIQSDTMDLCEMLLDNAIKNRQYERIAKLMVPMVQQGKEIDIQDLIHIDIAMRRHLSLKDRLSINSNYWFENNRHRINGPFTWFALIDAEIRWPFFKKNGSDTDLKTVLKLIHVDYTDMKPKLADNRHDRHLLTFMFTMACSTAQELNKVNVASTIIDDCLTLEPKYAQILPWRIWTHLKLNTFGIFDDIMQLNEHPNFRDLTNVYFCEGDGLGRIFSKVFTEIIYLLGSLNQSPKQLDCYNRMCALHRLSVNDTLDSLLNEVPDKVKCLQYLKTLQSYDNTHVDMCVSISTAYNKDHTKYMDNFSKEIKSVRDRHTSLWQTYLETVVYSLLRKEVDLLDVCRILPKTNEVTLLCKSHGPTVVSQSGQAESTTEVQREADRTNISKDSDVSANAQKLPTKAEIDKFMRDSILLKLLNTISDDTEKRVMSLFLRKFLFDILSSAATSLIFDSFSAYYTDLQDKLEIPHLEASELEEYKRPDSKTTKRTSSTCNLL